MGQMMRDHARQVWAGSGLTYDDLTPENLRTLRGMINRRMKESGLMLGSYRAHQRFSFHPAPRRSAYLRCRSHYFNDREAITFGSDGFVGFAGWADEYNVQPIVSAFCKWVGHIAARRTGQGGVDGEA